MAATERSIEEMLSSGLTKEPQPKPDGGAARPSVGPTEVLDVLTNAQLKAQAKEQRLKNVVMEAKEATRRRSASRPKEVSRPRGRTPSAESRIAAAGRALGLSSRMGKSRRKSAFSGAFSSARGKDETSRARKAAPMTVVNFVDAEYTGQPYVGEVALHFAVANNNLPMVRLMVEAGADFVRPHASGKFWYKTPCIQLRPNSSPSANPNPNPNITRSRTLT